MTFIQKTLLTCLFAGLAGLFQARAEVPALLPVPDNLPQKEHDSFEGRARALAKVLDILKQSNEQFMVKYWAGVAENSPEARVAAREQADLETLTKLYSREVTQFNQEVREAGEKAAAKAALIQHLNSEIESLQNLQARLYATDIGRKEKLCDEINGLLAAIRDSLEHPDEPPAPMEVNGPSVLDGLDEKEIHQLLDELFDPSEPHDDMEMYTPLLEELLLDGLEKKQEHN